MKTGAILGMGMALASAASVARADIAISSKQTQNMNCVAGVCTATAKDAVLNVGDLTSMLASGDVTVKAGGGASAIQVKAELSWSNASRLTLDAITSVGVQMPVTVAGGGGVTILTNDGGSGGSLHFVGSGAVSFDTLSSSLIVNGHSYTLENSIATLASAIAANPSGDYALANDYDASGDVNYRSSPIGGAFAGNFEGLGHTIAHLKVSTKDANYTGLFGRVAAGGALRDLRIVDAKISTNLLTQSKVGSAGILVGENDGTVSGCFASGSVQGRGAVNVLSLGGLVGYDAGAIDTSQAAATVFLASTPNNPVSDVGGLTGRVDLVGTVDRSSATGAVGAGAAYTLGGLVGENDGTISNSHATGSATSATGWVGGLVGVNTGVVEADFATGAVVVGSYVQGGSCSPTAGGLIGIETVYRTKDYVHSIDNSYATGTVSGGINSCAGGLVGDLVGRHVIATTSFSTGAVSGTWQGGFAGYGHQIKGVILQSNYWDLDTSGQTQPMSNKANQRGIAGLTDAQLKSGLPAGFDPAIWGQSVSVNNGYPYLLANPPE